MKGQNQLVSLEEAEDIKAKVDAELSPDLRKLLRANNLVLTINSIDALDPADNRHAAFGAVALDPHFAEELAEEELLDDMVSLTNEETGIHNHIFVSTKIGVRHGPRVKVAIDPPDSFNPLSDSASIGFDGTLKAGNISGDLQRKVTEFIALNHQALMDYWETKIGTAELMRRLRPIP